MYQEKYTQKEIYNGIEEFASKVDSDFDINNWYSFIDKCIGKAKKRDLLNIDYIEILSWLDRYKIKVLLLIGLLLHLTFEEHRLSKIWQMVRIDRLLCLK